MYTFEDSAKGEDREFFGYNYGAPMQKPNASSMLSGENIMTQTCHEVSKTVPYFKEYTPYYYNGTRNMSDFLAQMQKSFAREIMDTYDKDYQVRGLSEFPDGTFTIRHSNKHKLDYNLQINDLRYQ